MHLRGRGRRLRLAAGPATAGSVRAGDPVPSGATAELVARNRADEEKIRSLIGFVLARDSNCIDVGAHSGGVLREIVRVAPAGRHIAFEPLPHLCRALREEFAGVEIREAALSDHGGQAPFARVLNAEPWSGLIARTLPSGEEPVVEELTVRLEVLDEALDPSYRPSLIKIDVEGAELQVLRGGLETLRRHRPIVLLEHGLGSANVFGTWPADIHRLLCQEAGLRIFDLDGRGPYSLEELERAFHTGSHVNFVVHR